MKRKSHTGAWVAMVTVSAALAVGWAMWAAPATDGHSGPQPAGAAGVTGLVSAALPRSPVSGTVVSHADEDDVYAVDLKAGQAFTARISARAPAVVGLLLYRPGVTSLEQDDFVVAGWQVDRYPSHLVTGRGYRFVATEAGTYHLRVLEMGGFGRYTIEWAKGAAPALTISKSVTIPPGGSTRIRGVLSSPDGSELAGERVELWSAPYPSRYATTKVASTFTGAGGVYSFKVKPSRRTRYAATSMGTLAGYSMARTPGATIVPKVALGLPSVADGTKRRNRAFSVWGSFKPRHTSGAKTVRIRCYHQRGDGTYVLRRTVRAVNSNHSTYTRYKVRVSLPYRGRWKLYAFAPEDGLHAATLSTARTVTVR